jgi:hypothetical protein
MASAAVVSREYLFPGRERAGFDFDLPLSGRRRAGSHRRARTVAAEQHTDQDWTHEPG